MMLGLIRPDRGLGAAVRPRPAGAGCAALEGVAGFVEAPRFYPYLTGRRNLELLAALRRRRRGRRGSTRRSTTVELTDRAKDKVGGYSHGMRQRLGIAARAAARPAAAAARRARHRPRPGGHARHARADPAARRRGHDRAALEPPAGRGRGALQPRGDRPHAAAIVYEGRSPSCKRTAGAAYRLRTTDDDARARGLPARSAGSPSRAIEARRDPLHAPTRTRCRELSVALVEAGALIRALAPQTATLEELFFRLTEGDADAAPSRRPARRCGRDAA